MGEPTAQVISNARNMGFETEGINFLDLSPDEDFFAKQEAYDIFSPAEVERETTTSQITEKVQSLNQSVFSWTLSPSSGIYPPMNSSSENRPFHSSAF